MDQCEGSGSETANCNEHCSENYRTIDIKNAQFKILNILKQYMRQPDVFSSLQRNAALTRIVKKDTAPVTAVSQTGLRKAYAEVYHISINY